MIGCQSQVETSGFILQMFQQIQYERLALMTPFASSIHQNSQTQPVQVRFSSEHSCSERRIIPSIHENIIVVTALRLLLGWRMYPLSCISSLISHPFKEQQAEYALSTESLRIFKRRVLLTHPRASSIPFLPIFYLLYSRPSPIPSPGYARFWHRIINHI